MSKAIVIATAVVALAVGVAVGRYALRPSSWPATSTAETSPNRNDAAESASRAMTFTQPKAPPQ
ncbi:hypothetical protein G8O24_09545 [Bradyrhizobium sp. INPA01-394B]|jgi:hypothetical protein|uniref:Uncharacterized protein n=4 Tax=Hyphomicrobiales TaxID=356 RepID=K8NZY6_9BRAD|nr:MULTISPECIES: hypothetical protein [Hyphomicrobiales]MAH71347.1 hypothetical protein [Afipia sp.]OUX59542.1 MAG: hypothetical protein CBB64_19155 [Afipia sp. TMED4]RTM08489.1 MAG: hypothetical protein EKK31_09370 [Hyphomicrobiales bacterium]EKS33000.1 hypothetical protein HMPREF9695_05015 [Afipia broomeae ATCC 49717]MBC9877588.1 hypothetical protein [Bradyrhizobium campsiandrae]